jgi:tryptophan halogenase
MSKSVDKIVIVGGGTAGWLSAAYLAKYFQSEKPDALKITLIESQDVGTIGVGEATIPSLRRTLIYLGIDEKQFMLETSATFKQAIRFDDWVHLPKLSRGVAIIMRFNIFPKYRQWQLEARLHPIG